MNQPKVKYSLSNWDLVTVNPNYKTWNWKDIFCFWGINIQSVVGFSLIASLYVIYNLNTFVVFFGTILGSFFVYLFSNIIGKPSQKFGLPFAVLLRSSLGFNGSKFFGLIRILVGIFLFGIQTYFLSKIFGYLIRILIYSIDSSLLDKEIFLTFLLGLNIIDWFSIFFVIIFQTALFSIGIQYNKKIINYSAIIVYVGMIFFFFIVLLSDVKTTTQAFGIAVPELLYQCISVYNDYSTSMNAVMLLMFIVFFLIVGLIAWSSHALEKNLKIPGYGV